MIGKLDPVTISPLSAGVMLRLVCRAGPGTRQEEGGLLIRISVFFSCYCDAWWPAMCSDQWYVEQPVVLMPMSLFFSIYFIEVWLIYSVPNFFLWPCHGACGTLVSPPRIEAPAPPSSGSAESQPLYVQGLIASSQRAGSQ